MFAYCERVQINPKYPPVKFRRSAHRGKRVLWIGRDGLYRIYKLGRVRADGIAETSCGIMQGICVVGYIEGGDGDGQNVWYPPDLVKNEVRIVRFPK